MATGLGALDGQRSRAACLGLARLGDRRHGDGRQDVAPGQGPQHSGSGHPNVNETTSGRSVQDQLELGLPVVVVPARFAQGDAEPCGLRLQGTAVGVQRRGVGLEGRDDEQVHAERLRRGCADRLDLDRQLVGGLVAGGQEPQAAGRRHRCRQRRRRGTTRHGGAHDGRARSCRSSMNSGYRRLRSPSLSTDMGHNTVRTTFRRRTCNASSSPSSPGSWSPPSPLRSASRVRSSCCPSSCSVLNVPNPQVTPTNLLYNVVSGPGALIRYVRQRQFDTVLTRSLILGSAPGVVIGAFLRVHVADDPTVFRLVVAAVLLPTGLFILATTGRGGTATTRARHVVGASRASSGHHQRPCLRRGDRRGHLRDRRRVHPRTDPRRHRHDHSPASPPLRSPRPGSPR